MAKQNNLPPADLKPEDLVAQLMSRPRPHRKIDSPLRDTTGKNIAIVMYILTHKEQQICLINSENFTLKMFKDLKMVTPKADEKSEGYKSIFDNRVAAEVLSIACRKITDPATNPCWLTADVLSDKLTTDEIAVLYNEYLLLQKELGPIVSRMEQYEMDAWIEVIQQGGAVNFLAFTTVEAKIQLLQYLANLPLNSQTDKSSSL